MQDKISKEKINQILNSIDITGVIGRYVLLKPAGKNYKGLCPFHVEKTPSFVVSPDKGIYHCFGCGKGGNVINFLMNIENITFTEAVKTAAGISGIKIEISETENKVLIEKDLIHKVLDIASEYYVKNLNSFRGEIALKYLKSRDIKIKTIKDFKLGFALNDFTSLYEYLKGKKVPERLMLKAGLIKKSSTGGYIDYFRDRIIIPIFDSFGKTVAFGARTLNKENMPKYLNSPETPVFIKGQELYGLNFAKNSVLKAQTVIIVEGYMDAIRCHQEGILNTVASMGTSLTEFQVNTLSRYVSRIIIALDGDNAGQQAVIRMLNMFQKYDIDIEIVIFDDKEDPDSFISRRSADDFREKIKKSISLYDFQIKMIKGKYNLNTPEGKTRFVREVISVINIIPDLVKRDEYIKKISETANVREELIRHLNRMPVYRDSVRILNRISTETTEKVFLKILLSNPDRIPLAKDLFPMELFEVLEFKDIFNILYKLPEEEFTPKSLISYILEEIKNENRKKQFSELAMNSDEKFNEEVFRSLALKLRDQTLNRRLSELKKIISNKIANSELSVDDGDYMEYNELIAHFKKGAVEDKSGS